jgi:amino acid transporter
MADHETTTTPRTETSTTGAPVTGAHTGHDIARDRWGGVNWGAAFFGWLVAVAMTILLTSVIGAILAAVGSNSDLSRSEYQSQAQQQAGTIGIVAAIVLLVVIALSYYAGGYVAGRMSRFDGARQGSGAWLVGLLVTVLAIVLGWVFGSQYNLMDRVNLPRIPLSTDQLGWGGIIAAIVVLVVSFLAAVAGGKVGHRYHDKIDLVAHS